MKEANPEPVKPGQLDGAPPEAALLDYRSPGAIAPSSAAGSRLARAGIALLRVGSRAGAAAQLIILFIYASVPREPAHHAKALWFKVAIPATVMAWLWVLCSRAPVRRQEWMFFAINAVGCAVVVLLPSILS
jgi:hypothetical protein